MSEKAPESEIIKSKLKTAIRLIQQKRYAAARLVLREVENEAEAQAMLKYLNGKVEKRKVQPAISKGRALIVVIILFVCSLAMVVTWLLSDYLQESNLIENLLLSGGFYNEDELFLAKAYSYCLLETSQRQVACQEWAVRLMLDSPQIVQTCFQEANLLLSDADSLYIRNCLRQAHIPAPT